MDGRGRGGSVCPHLQSRRPVDNCRVHRPLAFVASTLKGAPLNENLPLSAFLRLFQTDPGPRLEAGKVVLRLPRLSDYKAWAELRTQSAAFLQPWEPTWPEDDLTRP